MARGDSAKSAQGVVYPPSGVSPKGPHCHDGQLQFGPERSGACGTTVLPEAVSGSLETVVWGTSRGGFPTVELGLHLGCSQTVDPLDESSVRVFVELRNPRPTRSDEKTPMMKKPWLWICLFCVFSVCWVLDRRHVLRRTPQETLDSLIMATALVGRRPELLKDIDRLSKDDPDSLSDSITFSSTEGNGHRTNRFWMSDAWEVASRYEFNRELKHYPEYAQILSILSDEASVRKSSKLYTGAMGVARILWGHREVVEDILKREIELEKSLSKDPRMNPVWVAMKREGVAESIELRKGSFQGMRESLRQSFVELYGGVSESTLQRLLSIEPHVW